MEHLALRVTKSRLKKMYNGTYEVPKPIYVSTIPYYWNSSLIHARIYFQNSGMAMYINEFKNKWHMDFHVFSRSQYYEPNGHDMNTWARDSGRDW